MQSNEQNLYNEYVVNFVNNSPLTVWAKGFKKYIDSGIEVLYFEDEYNGEAIVHLNPAQVLYVKRKRTNVALINK